MARGMSIHIGLNKVDPKKYGGWDGKLIACENDARDMDRLAKDAGFRDRTTLLTKDATVANLNTELRKAARTLDAGDILLFTYSGHGGQVPDINGPEDEPDRLDETMVLHDREYIDDELFKEFEEFAEGVRILALLDCCHSGSGIKVREILTPEAMKEQFQTTEPAAVEQTSRLMPLERQAEAYERDKDFYDTVQRELNAKDNRELGATALLVSACQDNQLAADGLRNGRFTGTLLQVWNEGKFGGGYRAFHREILKAMPAVQSPNFFVTGRSNKRFLRQRPFTI
ncbi:peptidase C14 [Streptomyces abyssalis]|uniref:Peptidase C14 n=1 Tax=Streptomyces abyssalis TaxID=933944 RepID=A0A1E7JQC1_9ACTN|nr:caspase family protein [Streptomyces abyssalis]OEU90413.1 peptidase C14 [Streptomyces abyssalis]OEU95149.1 peptidase C14 [Streptomyces abyssalis]OEV30976.1 peptidase C14 [Streptomyces nanshensis]